MRVFEPDRMALVNLRVAYEQVMPPEQYRIKPAEPISERAGIVLAIVKEVLV